MIPPKLIPGEKLQALEFIPDDDDQQESKFIPEVYEIDATVKPVNQQSIPYLLIKSEVLIYQGEEQQQLAKVIQQYIGENGIIVGRFDKNSVLNMLVYDVEFTDGAVKKICIQCNCHEHPYPS